MLLINFAMVIDDQDDARYVEALYLRLGKKMFKVANNILNDESESWGCVHDAIITLTDYLPAFKSWDETHQINFLYKCTRIHACREYNKKKKINEMTFSINGVEGRPEMDIVDEDAYVDKLVVNEENIRRVREAIQEMDDMYGDILFFKYFMNMKNIDIAREFELNINVVNTRIHRGLKILKKQLEGLI